MALFDIFGIGSSPDYLSGFMSEEERRRLQERAGQNALLQAGLSMLGSSGYSTTPVSLGQILGAGGQAGLAGYQGTMDRGVQNLVMQQKLAEMKRQKEMQERQDLFRKSIGMPNAERQVPIAPETAYEPIPSQEGAVAPTFNVQPSQPTYRTEKYFNPDVMMQQALQSGVLDFKDYLSLAAKQKAESPFAKIDPKDYTPESFRNYVQTNDITQLRPVDKTKEPNMTDEATRVSYSLFNKLPSQLTQQEMTKVNQYIEDKQKRVAQAGAPSSQPNFENAAKLRTEYNSMPAIKTYGEVQNAFEQIKTGLKSESPAGDLAAATKFMKLLDPGSVVRESELGMAMAATGVLDRANNYFNLLSTGKKLTNTQRKDFLDVSTKLFNAAKNTKDKLDARYASIARKGGLDPELVIGRTEADIMKEYGL